MQSLIINTESRTDFKLLKELATKLGLISRELSAEEQEEYGLVNAIKKGSKTKFVKRDEVLKSLYKNAK
jgi:hypothetical protein